MSTIVIIGSAFPLRGGLSTFNERLAEEFRILGHQVVIYTFSLQYPGWLFPGKTQYSDGPPPPNLDIRVRINSINPLNWIRSGREIARIKPDILVIKYWLPFMGPAFGTILRQVKANRFTRVISILDNIIPHEKRPGDRAFTQYFTRAVDGFIAMSREVLKDLREFSDKPASFIPHPIYDSYGEMMTKTDARKQLGLDPGAKYLLFFGFIRHYKGLDLLLRALEDSRLKALDIRLIVAGEFYEDPRPYELLLASPGLQGRLSLYTGYIPDREVRYYFSAADVVVQPYRSATQSGISQIAYHFEKPMIVTRVGGLPEIVPDGITGLVCEPDPADIADRILRFYREGMDMQFIPHIREEKKKFTWNRMVEEIIRLARLKPAT